MLDEGRPDKALELLGPRLRLRELYPDTDVFHQSELLSYYHAVAEYHFQMGREDLAGGMVDYLLELAGEPHEGLENLQQRIRFHTLQETLRNASEIGQDNPLDLKAFTCVRHSPE